MKFIPPNHPAVFQYIEGGARSKESAVMRVTEEIYSWCSPYWTGTNVFTITFVRGVARQYMKYMESEWKSGRIVIKGIYRTDP